MGLPEEWSRKCWLEQTWPEPHCSLNIEQMDQSGAGAEQACSACTSLLLGVSLRALHAVVYQ